MPGRRATGFVVALWLATAALATEPTPVPREKKNAQADRGRELVLEVCTYCHEFERVTRERLSKEDWSGLIKGMISEGPPVTDEEFSLIVDYLAKNFGEKNP